MRNIQDVIKLIQNEIPDYYTNALGKYSELFLESELSQLSSDALNSPKEMEHMHWDELRAILAQYGIPVKAHAWQMKIRDIFING